MFVSLLMRQLIPSLFVVAVLAGGCSSNESSSTTTGGKPPAADPNKKLNEMSEAEAKTYCSETQAYYASKLTAAETKSAACNLGAAFSTFMAKTDAEAQTMCKAAYDKCLADPGSEGDAGPAKDPCASFATNAKTCKDLTVAEFNACQEEQLTFFKGLSDPTLCTMAKAPTDAGTGPTGSSPKCDVVKTKCPTLSSDGG